MNRIDRSVSRIIEMGRRRHQNRAYRGAYQGVSYAIIFEKAPGPVGEIKMMKIYIGGKNVAEWPYLRDGSQIQRVAELLAVVGFCAFSRLFIARPERNRLCSSGAGRFRVSGLSDMGRQEKTAWTGHFARQPWNGEKQASMA